MISMNSSFNNIWLNSFKTDETLDTARKWNIFATLPIIIIGLIGHSLTILVFVQKRFRTNSSNIFLLCLAFNDSLYLINHFFEDTLRTYKDIYVLNAFN